MPCASSREAEASPAAVRSDRLAEGGECEQFHARSGNQRELAQIAHELRAGSGTREAVASSPGSSSAPVG
jgi:hypothetical protein